jgi:prefoldin subunit 5
MQGQTSALGDELAQINRDLDDVRSQTDGLRVKVENLDASLQETQAQLKAGVQNLNDRLDSEVAAVKQRLDSEMAAVNQRVDSVRNDVAVLQKASERFGKFLTGLRDLLITIQEPPTAVQTAATPASQATPTPVSSAPPSPSTPVPTATPVARAPRVPPPEGAPPDRLAGLVWLDANANGQREAGEQPLPEISVVITNWMRQTRTLTTDSQGRFAVARMALGAYTVTVKLPDDLIPTTPASVSVTLPGDAGIPIGFGAVRAQ